MKTVESKLNILIVLVGILVLINLIAGYKMLKSTKENYPSEYTGGINPRGPSSGLVNRY